MNPVSVDKSFLRTISEAPYQSELGFVLTRLHERALLTQSVFEKYVDVSFGILVCLIISVAGLIYRPIEYGINLWYADNKDRFSLCAIDMLSHLVFLVLLPYRIFTYLVFQNHAIFAVRNAEQAPHHMLFGLTEWDPVVIKAIYKNNIPSEKTIQNWNLLEKAKYKIAYNYERLDLISGPVKEKQIELAISENDAPLLNDIINGSGKVTLFPILVKQGADKTLVIATRKQLQQKAIDIFSEHAHVHRDAWNEQNDWFEVALDSGQKDLIKKTFEDNSRVFYRPIFKQCLCKIAENSVKSSLYDDIIVYMIPHADLSDLREVVSLYNTNGNTSLLEEVICGYAADDVALNDLIKLLDAGADVNVYFKSEEIEYYTPLHLAVKFGRVKFVKAIGFVAQFPPSSIAA